MLLNVLHDFKVQARVIWALVFREMYTRYGRENIGFLWIVGEPALFCVGVAVMWTAIRPAHEHGLAMTAFVVTGYVPLTMWRHCVSRSVKAFQANGSLLFHRQVTPLDIIAARLMLEIIGSLVAGLLVGLGAWLLGYMDAPKNVGLLYLGLFYMIMFSAACGLLFAYLSERSEFIEKMIGPITYLSIPFSGAFTMVDWLPVPFQKVVLFSPSVHAVEMIRAGEFGPGFPTHYSVFFVTWVNAVLILVAVSLVIRSRRFIMVQ